MSWWSGSCSFLLLEGVDYVQGKSDFPLPPSLTVVFVSYANDCFVIQKHRN